MKKYYKKPKVTTDKKYRYVLLDLPAPIMSMLRRTLKQFEEPLLNLVLTSILEDAIKK